MTHRFKKPGANVIVHTEEKQPQQPQSIGSDILNGARSTVAAVQNHLSHHYMLWTGIGLACGAALYLFATQHGRGVTSQISDQITDIASSSLTTVKDSMTHGLHKLEDATIDFVDQTIGQQEMGEKDLQIPQLRVG